MNPDKLLSQLFLQLLDAADKVQALLPGVKFNPVGASGCGKVKDFSRNMKQKLLERMAGQPL